MRLISRLAVAALALASLLAPAAATTTWTAGHVIVAVACPGGAPNNCAGDGGGVPLLAANNLSDVLSASTARTNLGLAIGTNVEAWDTDLDAIAALPATAGILKRTGAGAFGLAINGTDFTLVTAATCTNQAFTGVTAAGVFTCGSVVTAVTCTNQALTAVTAGGAFTCSSVTDAMLSGQVSVAHGGTGATGGRAALSNLSGEYVLCQSGSSVSVTGTVAETNAASCTIPAGAMGTDGCLKIWSLWSVPNNADTKSFRVRLSNVGGDVSGTSYVGGGGTTIASIEDFRLICNAHSASSQVGYSGTSIGTAGAALTTSSWNSASTLYINFTIQNAVSGDTTTLSAYSVELSATAGN